MRGNPQPFYRRYTKTWYVTINGKQIRLGKTHDEAIREWHKVMAAPEQYAPEDPSTLRHVVKVIDEYLAWCKANRNANTFRFYQHFLSSFAKAIGTKKLVTGFKPKDVTRWVDDRFPTASNSTKHHAIACVKRAFAWAKAEGHIEKNPIVHMSRPSPGRRETVITEKQLLVLLEKTNDQNFRDVLWFLWLTGARPQEMCAAETRHFEEKAKRLVFPAAEAKGKKFPRVIYLPPKVFQIVRQRVCSQGDGPIFRNTKGTAWNKNSLNCRFRRMKKIISLPGLCAYAIRHSFATNALRSGKADPVTLSILLGHSDPSMVAKVYQHLARDPKHMHDAARRITTSRS